MHKINFALKILVAVFAVLIISNTATADEKPEIFVQLGHSGSVNAVTFSSDGRYIVSGSDDNTVKLWEVSTGREIRTFIGHAKPVYSVALSPDDRYALSGSADETIKLWDIQTGKKIRTFIGNTTFTGYRGTVYSVVFSPDGKYIASGRQDRTVRLWETSSGKEIRTMTGHAGMVKSVAFSPDGRHIVLSGSGDNTVRLLEASTGRKLRTFKGHTSSVNAVAFSPNGKYIASGSFDNTVRLWETSSGRQIRTLAGHGEINSVVFSPDGKYIVSGSADHTIRLWEVSTGREMKNIKGHTDSVNSVAFSPDGTNLVSSDGKVSFWDIPSGQLTHEIKRQYSRINFANFSSDGRYLATKAGKIIMLWDVSTGKEIRTLTGHTDNVTSAAFSPDGRHVVSGSGDKTIRIWEVSTGKEIRAIAGHIDRVYSVVFSPDGRNIVAGGSWYKTKKDRFRERLSYMLHLRETPPEDTDNAIKLWEASSGREIKTLTGHKRTVKSVAISPDGRYIASGSMDNTAKLWDTSTGREIRTLTGHTGWVVSVAFSYDGRYIASGGKDGTLRLWNISTGKEIAQFITFTDGEWIVITPEGYFNASPNGAKHLNVRLGNNVYSIDNFYERFFDPVYVASVLQGKKVGAVADIRKGVALPPDVRIISPEPNAKFSTDTISITVSAKDTGGGIDEIRLYHNGKAIGEDQRAVKIVPKPVPAGSKQGGNEVTKAYTVTLVDGLNTFRAVGFSRDRTASNPYELIVKLTAPSKDVSLYVFAAGINKYKNPALNLNYAEPDARGIVDFFKQKGRGLFKNVTLIGIYNEQATKQGITSKLKQLQNTQLQDAVLIYLAGHGESLGDTWYLIPHEVTYPEREEDVKTKGISSEELSGYIKDIKAQKILILIDACKSGAVMIAFRGFEDRKALSQLSRSTGVHIIAASTKDQFAAEVKELGHGVFTYTLLEGLKGKASGRGETVTVRKLMGYVEEHLPDITKKYKQEAQYPVVDSRGMDFPLVIVK